MAIRASLATKLEVRRQRQWSAIDESDDQELIRRGSEMMRTADSDQYESQAVAWNAPCQSSKTSLGLASDAVSGCSKHSKAH